MENQVLTQSINPYELRDRIIETVERTLENINKTKGKYQWSLNGVFVYENKFLIQLSYGVEYFEISEAVSEICYQSENCKDENDYEALYQETLKEINENCVINAVGAIDTEKAFVKLYPLSCEGDYCTCGLAVDIVITIENATNTEFIIELIKSLDSLISVSI